MLYRPRPLNDYRDLLGVEYALQRVKRSLPPERSRHVNVGRMLEHIREAAKIGRAVLVGPYLLMYDLGPLWGSDSLFLIEELVLRITPVNRSRLSEEPGPKIIVDTLRILARENNADAIVTGDIFSGIMGEVYTQAGFTKIGSQFLLNT